MLLRRISRLVLLLSGVVLADPIRFTADLRLGLRVEPGVETRLLGSGLGLLECGTYGQVFAGITLAALDNPGIARYGLGGNIVLYPRARVRFAAQANHDQWSAWQVGENRVSLAIAAAPGRLDLALGLAWRAPLLPPQEYRTPFNWQSQMPEWNLLYRFSWEFLRRPGARLGAWVANYDDLTIHNPQQFPFGLTSRFPISEHWYLSARAGSALQGLSGLLVSLGELDLALGARYDF